MSYILHKVKANTTLVGCCCYGYKTILWLTYCIIHHISKQYIWNNPYFHKQHILFMKSVNIHVMKEYEYYKSLHPYVSFFKFVRISFPICAVSLRSPIKFIHWSEPWTWIEHHHLNHKIVWSRLDYLHIQVSVCYVRFYVAF